MDGKPRVGLRGDANFVNRATVNGKDAVAVPHAQAESVPSIGGDSGERRIDGFFSNWPIVVRQLEGLEVFFDSQPQPAVGDVSPFTPAQTGKLAREIEIAPKRDREIHVIMGMAGVMH